MHLQFTQTQHQNIHIKMLKQSVQKYGVVYASTHQEMMGLVGVFEGIYNLYTMCSKILVSDTPSPNTCMHTLTKAFNPWNM